MSSFENALQEITSKKNVDLNLPNFTSTKYNKPYWRIMHFTTYFLFALFFLLAQKYLSLHPNTDSNAIKLLRAAAIARSTTSRAFLMPTDKSEKAAEGFREKCSSLQLAWIGVQTGTDSRLPFTPKALAAKE